MNKNKTFFAAAVIMATALITSPLKAQVTIGAQTPPDPNAVLELRSNTNRGLLLPRLALTATNSTSPMTAPVAAGMVVYNTATAGTSPNNVTPGYYYNDGTKWVRIANQADLTTYTGSTSIALNGTSFERAALSGDVTAAQNNNSVTVTKIQGQTVSATAPTAGQVLTSNGTTWSAQTPAAAWLLTGNAGTTASNFIGTTDNQPLRFKVNKQNAGIIDDGLSSVGIGYRVLDAITTGTSNTAIGHQALYALTTGNTNTAVGMYALMYTTGSANIGIGGSSGANLIDGGMNIFIGVNSANNLTSGSSNIAIGGVRFPDPTGSNQLNIANLIYGTNVYNSTNATTNPARMGIGTGAPNSTLEVNGSVTNTSATNAGTGVAINFALSNLAYSTSTDAAPAFNCQGVKDGGTYTLAWQSATAGTATVSTNMTTTKMASNAAKGANQHAVYTIVCIGSVAYVYTTLF